MVTLYAKFLTRHPWLVLLFGLAVLAMVGAGVSRLRVASDMEVFFSPGDPQLEAFTELRETYARDDNAFLVLAPRSGDVFSPERLAILEQLTAAAWELPYSVRVDSIVNHQHTEASGDDLVVRPLVEDALRMSAAELATVRRVATTDPMLVGKLSTADGRMAGINITLFFPPGTRTDAVPELTFAARALAEAFEAAHPDLELLVTGKVPGNQSFTEASVADFLSIVPLALLIAIGCIALYMYSTSRRLLTALGATLATVLVIIASVGVGMGFAGYSGYMVTPLLVNAPTVILTLAVADCMHLYVTWFAARRRGVAPRAAVVHTVKVNFRAVMLTSVTTIIGFLALNFSESPPFHDLGNTVAVGIAAAWLFAIVTLPALICVLPAAVVPRPEGRISGMERLADWVLAHRRFSLLTVLAGILLAASFLPRNGLYDVWSEYFAEDHPFRIDSDRVRDAMNGFDSIEFSLGAGEPGGIVDPAYLRDLDAFAGWLSAQPEVVHVWVFSDVMKRLNRNMHGDDPAWHRLPEDRELAAQYLLLFEFSLPFGLDLNNQINIDKSATRLIAGLRTSSSQDLLELQERAIDWQKANTPPAFFHPGASTDSMFAHIGKRNVIRMWIGSLIGLGVISLIIALALRSPLFGLLSLLLNLLPMLVGFGIWGLLVGRIGLGLSVVSGVTMGIVVDFTVHLLSKYQIGQRERQLDTPDAIRYAFSTVGVALVVTTVVLVVNFGLLTFSGFTLNAELGELTAGIILAALVIDLFFLPPLLMLLEPLRAKWLAQPPPELAAAGVE